MPSYLKANDTQASLNGKDIVDMSKVSDTHINMTLNRLQEMYENATGVNATIIENVDDVIINETKIELLNITRRKYGNKFRRAHIPWHGYKDEAWNWASSYAARQKIMDTMLTLIYMARHHLKTMAMHQIFAQKDDAYRLAYLWTKLEILHERIKAIYNTMADKAYTYDWQIEWDRPYYFLMLHQKALKVHTQFNFYFWIIAKIHHRYSLLNQLYQTTPTTQRRPTDK